MEKDCNSVKADSSPTKQSFGRSLLGKRTKEMEKKPCHHIFDRLIVLRDGTVTICCNDIHYGGYILGNAKDQHPMDIFNCARMKEYRKLHLEGKKNSMEICKGCSILYSEAGQVVE